MFGAINSSLSSFFQLRLYALSEFKEIDLPAGARYSLYMYHFDQIPCERNAKLLDVFSGLFEICMFGSLEVCWVALPKCETALARITCVYCRETFKETDLPLRAQY